MEVSHKTHRPHIKVGKDEENKKVVGIRHVIMITLDALLSCELLSDGDQTKWKAYSNMAEK